MPPQDAALLLSSMGLSSVPSWIRPFSSLSNGEQYRASIAKTVFEQDVALIDEYTSVVDRNVAKSMSNALSKYIRRSNKKVVLATCHYDILEWLHPDWIFDLNKGGVLERGDYLQRPRIQLQVYRTTPDTWRMFEKHHYMTSELNEGSQCFCFTWNNQLVAFASILSQTGKGLVNAVRFHRIVVLPDFQGLGIGREITNFISAILKNEGKKIYIKTVNPRLGKYFESSPMWRMTGYNGKTRDQAGASEASHNKAHVTRPSFCAEYVGEPINGFHDILLPIDKMRYNKSMEGQLSLW